MFNLLKRSEEIIARVFPLSFHKNVTTFLFIVIIFLVLGI